MECELYQFEMPIVCEKLAHVEEIVRQADVLTFFDESFDVYKSINYRLERAKHGTSTSVLLDLNCFKDILMVGREDSRDQSYRKLGAALCLFFRCADIEVEPCMPLHESPKDADGELCLFRKIDNAAEDDLLQVMLERDFLIPSHRLPDVPVERVMEKMALPLQGSQMLETALLKLANLIRGPGTNFDRLESFLRWCLEDYIFLAEPIMLAFHQLVGNQPSPLLKGLNKENPAERLAGVKNALYDLLLLREWLKRVGRQSIDGKLWLLCTRDYTLSNFARKMMVVGDGPELESAKRRAILNDLWGAQKARRITELYDGLMAQRDSNHRKSNHWSVSDTKVIFNDMRSQLMS
jgi:hypothetical protein